jgi:heme a synthase
MTSERLAQRLAIVTAIATLALIVAGGLVTNTGAALAVPDWPTTFGHNMFAYPWSAMIGGVFYEHSHRLLGSLVGLLTLALAAALWPHRGALRMLGLVAVAAVIVQGILGGLRVVLLEGRIAIVHGCLAQAFFALVVAIAWLTSAKTREPSAAIGKDAALRGLTVAAASAVYLQIVFGALLTHLGRLDLHLAGAVIVFALVPIVTARLRRTRDPIARPVAMMLLALLGIQLALGIGAWIARFTDVVVPGGLALPVTHRLVAALILGAAVTLAVRVAAAGPRTRGAREDVERGVLAERSAS